MSFGKGLRVQRMITLSESNPLTLKTINPNSIVTTRMQYSQMVAIIRGIRLEILLGKNGRGGRWDRPPFKWWHLMKLQNQKLRKEMHAIRFITLTFSLVVSPFAWLYGTQTFPTRTIACPSTSGLSSSLSYHLASSLLWNYRMGNSWLRLIAYWNILGSSMIWGPRIPSKTPSLTHSPNTQSKTCTSKLLQKCSVKNYIMIVNLSLSKWLINAFRFGS